MSISRNEILKLFGKIEKRLMELEEKVDRIEKLLKNIYKLKRSYKHYVK